MTGQERNPSVSFTLTGDNLTVKEWKRKGDVSFRTEMAVCLRYNSSIGTFEKDDLQYVHQTPTAEDDGNKTTLRIDISLRADDDTSVLFANDTFTELMKSCAEQSIKKLPEVFQETPVTVLDGPDCTTLFAAYRPLWIALIAAAFLSLLFSAIITCYCWKRGKSVQLKTDKGIDLPSTDELRHSNEMSGLDNPALVISPDTSPSKKKQAPHPPTSTPTMTTFGKGMEQTEGVQYETGIVPYDTPANGESAEAPNEVEDTKL